MKLTEKQQSLLDEFKKEFEFDKIVLCGLRKEQNDFVTYSDEIKDIDFCYAIDCLKERRRMV